MPTYAETLRELYARAGKDARFCIERVEDAARSLGSPQRGLHAVHVAGSNGKGSVTSMVEAYLRRAGYRTGMFTSPHLHRYTERIRVGGREIGRRDVVRLFAALDGHVARGDIPWLTFFEITALMAFRHFVEREVDMAVVEVGMGGRLDATNVLSPDVTVITTISLEHLRILGRTLAAIAREKAGILKPGVPLVLGRVPPQARMVILEHARRLGCEVWEHGRHFRHRDLGDGWFDFEGPEGRIERLRTRLPGAHQAHNAAVAAAVAQRLGSLGWPFAPEALRAALGAVRWPGRMERVPGEPETILECAHNPDGLRALARHMRGRMFHVVFGGMADKPIEKMLGLIAPITARLYVTAPDVPRALRPADYPRSVRATRVAGVDRAVDRARRDALRRGLPVLVTGSIFTISTARAHLLALKRVDPIITS
jgi:dihydrofolate synthase/folylpolyglutamate synthase